ncbi:MAG: twin-arginine translocation signal domain-containing protein [Sulfurimonas sp.]|nr:twin-arginine translocation signal domain-containing protein [Sulfurimonas sp.]
MQRRDFIKLSLVASAALILPSRANADTAFTETGAQTIIIFTYGGASQLAGNLTNLTEIESLSQNKYKNYFKITPTTE